MPLERRFFNVLIERDDTDEEYRVEVRGVDQLRAELEGKRRGVHIKDAMHTTYLWAWAASIREDRIDPKTSFTDFMTAVVQVEGDEEETETVDPTRPAVGDDSPSASPEPFPGPPSNGG
jgi:hypothetical protein